MPEVLFPRQEIKPLVRHAEAKRCAVYDARDALRQAELTLKNLERHIENLTAIRLKAALEDGEITGRNSEERKIQVAALEAAVDTNWADEIVDAQEEVLAAQRALDVTTAELAAIEDEISLTRAWLYSMTRIR